MDMIVVDMSCGLLDGGDCVCFLFRYNDSVFFIIMFFFRFINFRGIFDLFFFCYLFILKIMFYVS